MKKICLTRTESTVLIALSLIGLIIPNGVFLYYFLSDQTITNQALSNPISLVFIIEAFVLMFLFAWLLNKASIKKPTPLLFIILSLLGSMVFSVPLAIYSIFNSNNEPEL